MLWHVPARLHDYYLRKYRFICVYVSDLQPEGASDRVIDLLIGADYYAKILTGRIEHLSNGLVAMKTCWGWTLSDMLNEA